MKRINYSNVVQCNLFKVSKQVYITYMYTLHVCQEYVYITIFMPKSCGLYSQPHNYNNDVHSFNAKLNFN